MNSRALSITAAFAALAWTSACTSFEPRREFTTPLTLGGQTISAEALNEGRDAYMHYCYACHGRNGDGKGPAAKAYRPPPRDFRSGIYKFAKVVDGLPHDEDLRHIVTGGLSGTPMLPWDVPDTLLMPIIHYIKTFAPAWQDPDEQLGTRILAGADPWAGNAQQAIARGNKMYHGYATCQQCHAAYATKQEIYEFSREVGNQAITEFRDNLYLPELKESTITVDSVAMKILPPDFLWHPIRGGATVPELYRTIAAGVSPVMPAWHGSMPEKDIWAIAYYVRSLLDFKGTPGAAALRDRLKHQPAFVVPGAAAAAAPAPGQGAGAPPAPAPQHAPAHAPPAHGGAH